MKSPENYLKDVGPQGRTMLLPALLEAQSRFGYISQETAREIGERLHVPLADVSGVIEFYSMLHDTPTGDAHIRICTSPSCSAQGGRKVLKDLLSDLGTEVHATSQDGALFVEQVECLGLGDNAPSALVGDVPIGHVTPKRLLDTTDDRVTQVYGDERIITGRCGVVDPCSLIDYLEHEGFTGLQRAFDLPPEQICGAVRDSGLLGRGGTAFKTDIKWEGAAAAHATPKYIVCNADESEPGTFNYPVLLENDPFAILTPERPSSLEDAFPSGKGHLTPLEYVPSAELPDDEYPFILSSGRVLYHWHGGTMTRRSKLEDIYPDPTVEIHPEDADPLGIKPGDWIKVRSRRGEIEIKALVTERSPQGMIFIPFHFAEAAANELTFDVRDPRAKIPDYKVCAVTIETT